MKRYREIIQSETAPSTSDLWIIDNGLKYFNGGWKDLGGKNEVTWDDIKNKPDQFAPKVLRIPEDKLRNGITLSDEEFDDYASKIQSGYLVAAVEYHDDGSIKSCRPIEAYYYNNNNNNRIVLKSLKSNSGTKGYISVVETYVTYSKGGGESVYRGGTFGAYTLPYNGAKYLAGDGNWKIFPVADTVTDADTSDAVTAQSVAATLNTLLQSLRNSGLMKKS